MAALHPASRKGLVILVIGLAAVVWFLARREAPRPAAASSQSVMSPEIPAAPSSKTVISPEMAPAPAGSSVMPLAAPDLERFQEASSRATRELEAESPGLPYAVAASRAARRGIAAAGYDPDRTLDAWLSPPFTADLATRRAADNLLSVILGDTAGDADFARILDELDPEVRALAMERRAAKTR
ncbi:MAG: hypothetical protein KA248_00685 [Kiritimatiellae bacterium]|nr:hypothetical protein [Kiritimatiellia bacterium]